MFDALGLGMGERRRSPSPGAARPSIRPGTAPRATGARASLFPLSGTVYLPDTEHILSVFEPRYRVSVHTPLRRRWDTPRGPAGCRRTAPTA